MEGGNFTIRGEKYTYGIARAKEIMNSKSSKESRWSVKINTSRWLATGIGTKLQQMHEVDDRIMDYNKKAIIFSLWATSWHRFIPILTLL